MACMCMGCDGCRGTGVKKCGASWGKYWEDKQRKRCHWCSPFYQNTNPVAETTKPPPPPPPPTPPLPATSAPAASTPPASTPPTNTPATPPTNTVESKVILLCDGLCDLVAPTLNEFLDRHSLKPECPKIAVYCSGYAKQKQQHIWGGGARQILAKTFGVEAKRVLKLDLTDKDAPGKLRYCNVFTWRVETLGTWLINGRFVQILPGYYETECAVEKYCTLGLALAVLLQVVHLCTTWNTAASVVLTHREDTNLLAL